MNLALTTRIRIATLVVLCLLLTQFATLAYACPPMPRHSGHGQMDQGMKDCPVMRGSQMDLAQAGLCQAHCASAHQLHESKSSSDLPSAVFLPGIWLVRMVPEPLPLATHARCRAPLAHWPPGQPQLYLIHQVFRL